MFWTFSLKKIPLFFVTEWRENRLYWTHLPQQEKQEIKKNKLRYFASLFISLGLHIVFLTSILNMVSKQVELSEEIKIRGEEVDFELTEGMVSSDVHPVYDDDSEVIIKSSLLVKPEDKQTLLLNNLLEKLKQGKMPTLSSSVLKPKSSYHSRLGQTEKTLMARLQVKSFKIPESKTGAKSAGFWNQVRMLKSDQTDSTGINNTEMMKVIDQHSFQFRDCYEKALLKDEKLSVRAVFLLKLNQSK